MSDLQVFGVRHHGPGCARSLRAALEALAPDVVLVEGPPDAEDVLPLLASPEMRPPVALLVYAPERPSDAAFFPFAEYSPEWQALRYALDRGIPARFMDLPQAVRLAEAPEPPAPPEKDESEAATAAGRDQEAGEESVRDDPVGALAEAAGYADHELWWEHQIEQRHNAEDLFAAILEAMTALRAGVEVDDPVEARREAWMRQCIRAARTEGFARIAAVCGAWHAPAIADPGPAKPDADLLRGMKRAKVAATWVPWTNDRLSSRSGYGAGVRSPGWYAHLWTARDRSGSRWLARSAALLRAEGLDTSSASVIEAVRLAEALAAMRGLPMPGLAELDEAMLAVLCGGDDAPMRLIRERLEVGVVLGEVPADAPALPLQRDLQAKQRALRLKPSAEIRALDLDLRTETGRGRSRLLHALRLLDVPWAEPQRVSGKSGTFHELWSLHWRPELAVAVVEAGRWGNTVEAAASARLRADAEGADLPRLTQFMDAAMLAGLPDALGLLLARVREQAAAAAEVGQLMRALPPLARVARYGDVRQTASAEVASVVDALFERVVVGLPGASASLDDEAAARMAEDVGAVQERVALLDRAEQGAEWLGVLGALARDERVHGLLRGYCCRLLLDQGAMPPEELQRLAGLALSPVQPGPHAAAWLEGALRGSGMLLLHQDGLWRALDGWLTGLGPEAFVEMLPLVRRAFSGFQPPERRTMGEKVRSLRGAPARDAGHGGGPDVDEERAALVLPVLARILGVPYGD